MRSGSQAVAREADLPWLRVSAANGFAVTPEAGSEKDHWLAAFGGIARLDSFVVDTDGSVTVVIKGDLSHEGLPGLVAKL